MKEVAVELKILRHLMDDAPFEVLVHRPDPCHDSALRVLQHDGHERCQGSFLARVLDLGLNPLRTGEEVNKGEPPFETLDDLFQLIRESSVLLVLLSGGRYGTGIGVGGNTAHVSFWEAELFYAALAGKTVRVFQVDDFTPGPKLAALLAVLRSALSPGSWSGPYSRTAVVSAVHDFLIDHIDRSAPRFSPRRFLGRLVDGLCYLRGRDATGGSAERESFQFLDGRFFDATVQPDEGVIRRLLGQVSTLPDEEKRLTRLWLVFRELSGTALEGQSHAHWLPYWNAFFGQWASAGSWYGLHSHAHLAVLPALVSLAKVRHRMSSLESSEWQDDPTHYPGGALASSRYSIAGYMKSRKNRRFMLGAASKDLERALSEGVDDQTNLLAIRASIYRRLGAFSAAVADYEAVLHQRRAGGASDSAVGEALSELGYGYLFLLRIARGRALLEEGVRLLESNDVRPGFLVRAKRKLAASYALSGHPLRARKELREAVGLARKHGVLDQIR